MSLRLLVYCAVVLFSLPCWTTASAEGLAPDLVESLMRLPTSEGRRARLVQELSDPSNTELENEQLGSALAVLGSLAADKRDDPYIVRLFLIASLQEDPDSRNEALLASRRGQGPPAATDGPGRDEAARFLLERKWLYVREEGKRMYVADYEGARMPLSRFVYKVKDDEIASVIEREARRSWGVFGALFAGGFGASVAGGLNFVAASPTGFDGLGGGASPSPETARAVGGTLIGVGVIAVLVGAVQRSVVAARHRRAFRRYYTKDRLRQVTDRRNQDAADGLGITPEAVD